MALPASLAALQTAARLKSLDSPANVSALDPVFAVNPHANAAEMASADANAGTAETALGDAPSIQALRAAAGFARENQTADQMASDADLYSGGVAKRALAGAGVQNAVGDALSEGKYGRETLPYADQAHRMAQADAQTDATLRYLQPAQVQAQGVRDAADMKARGAVEAETVKANQAPLHAWLNGMIELIKANKMPSPADAEKLRSLLGAGSTPGPTVR